MNLVTQVMVSHLSLDRVQGGGLEQILAGVGM